MITDTMVIDITFWGSLGETITIKYSTMKKYIAFIIGFILPILMFTSCQKEELLFFVTTSVSPEGAGSVSPSSSEVTKGSSITFRATANENYIFAGWSGGISGTQNPMTTIVTSNMKVTANFTLRSYPLTLTTEGEGQVFEKIISSRAEYESGTVVELIAVPADNWLFDHWEGDFKGTDATAQITITSSMNITAVFVKKHYSLSIDVQGSGTVKEEVLTTRSLYEEGTTVKLTALADEFWKFDHWEGDLVGSDNPQSITIQDSLKVCAIFVPNDPGIVFTETEYISPYEINKRMGMGINMACQLEAYREDGIYNIADETYWGNPLVTQTYFDKIANDGFKSVRIPITWMGTFGEAPDYNINEQRLNRIAEVVGYAEKAGLNAMINMHHDDAAGHQDEHPNPDDFWIDPWKAASNPEYNEKVKEQLTALWTQIARKFRDKGDFLMFESFNEPGSGFFWSWATDEEKQQHSREYECLNEWNQTFVDAVRATGGNNATRWLIVVGAAAKERNLDRFILPQDYVSNNRLMIAIHYYEPESYVFGASEEWGHTAIDVDAESIRFDEKHMEKEFKRYKEQYMDKGIPLCVNEIGCFNRDTERAKAFQLYYLEYLVRTATLNGFSTFIWDDGGRPNVIRGEFLYWRKTGEYFAYAKEIIDVIRKASYLEDPSYTLKSIYDRAPFPYEEEIANVKISDKEFKNYLLEDYDFNEDGEISSREALAIEYIDVCSDNVSSLEGIEKFSSLKALSVNGSSPGMGKLTAIDLSNNHKLEELSFLNNRVTNLNISGCKELKFIHCWENKLTEIDLSSQTLLVELCCAQNFLKEIDITHCHNILNLAINDNKIENVDLSNNRHLINIECGGNALSSLDVSACINLETLHTSYNGNLATIYLSEGQEIKNIIKDDHTQIVRRDYIAFEDFEFEKYLIERFDVNADGFMSTSELSIIDDVNICTDNISDVSPLVYSVNLINFSANGSKPDSGQLKEINLPEHPKLEKVSFYDNQVSKLNLSKSVNLKSLLCWENKLKTLDVSKFTNLEVLCCAQNQLTEIDVSHCTNLRVFAPNDNKLSELDLSNNLKLEEIEIQGNPNLKVVYLKKGQVIPKIIKDDFTEIVYK